MEDLLPYFERELVYLRRLGREFYERYPRVGDLTPLRDADSYSVRLLRRPTRTCRFAKGASSGD